MAISNQFHGREALESGKIKGVDDNPGDDSQDAVIDGDATPDQLAEAAAALNAAEHGAVDPDTGRPEPAPERHVPPSIKLREEIAERARARRMDDMVPGIGVGPSDDPDGDTNDIDLSSQRIYFGDHGDTAKNFMGDDIPAPAPAREEPPEERTPTAEPGADDADLITVKVDGEERQISRDELIRNYQKGEAADQRLQKATELLQKAQSAAAANLSPTSRTTATDQTDPDELPTDEGASEPGLDDIDFAAIAERIQIGEPEEATAALKDLVQQAVGNYRQDNAVDPASLTEQVATAVQDRTESIAARAKFETDFADIVADDQLHQMTQRNVMELMLEDFAANGATEDMLAAARANPAQITTAHRTMRTSGQFDSLRSPEALYQEAGGRTRDWVTKLSGGEPRPRTPQPQPENPSPGTSERRERQRQAQHAPASRRAPPAAPQPAQPRIKTPSETIAEMKRARGQFPAGSQRAGAR